MVLFSRYKRQTVSNICTPDWTDIPIVRSMVINLNSDRLNLKASGNIYIALSLSLAAAVIVIYVCAFFISVVKGISIRKRFLEMVLISLGIVALAFGIGLLARFILHIEVV